MRIPAAGASLKDPEPGDPKYERLRMKSAVTRPRMSQLPSLFQPAPQGAPNLLRARTGASGHPVTAWGQYPIPPSSGQATGSACFGLSSRSLHSPRGKETTRFLWCDPQLRAPVPALARQILFDFPKIIVHIVSDMCRMNFVSDITRTEDANVENLGRGSLCGCGCGER